jgi:bifunctional N-acetylglucosamine-1-phosphate-uridyltransferase/glucosamine-1-phosphate-acetyltransferase GlmU-like protein
MATTTDQEVRRRAALATARAAVEELTRKLGSRMADDHDRRRMCELLDAVVPVIRLTEVWPVVVAAGKGTRARESGIQVPKPVAQVAGVPVVRRVLEAVAQGAPRQRHPIVIVSTDTEAAVKAALIGIEAEYLTQGRALGTANAVRHASVRIAGFEGRVLVVWGTQPVLLASTVRRTLALAELFPEYAIVLPTAVMDTPYAPLLRDNVGRVLGSRETRMGHEVPDSRGESNVGIFAVRAPEMVRALEELHQEHWLEPEQRYDGARGELGFPNEIIPHLARKSTGVLALPIADWREEKGLKVREDIAVCERYLSELRP